MALPPQKFREIVFQILYSSDMGGTEGEEFASFMMNELKVTRRSMREAYARREALWAKKEELDAAITAVSKTYDFERISRVERNILRLGVYEILHDPEIPGKVAIAEAIRLTRKFGTLESAHFVNAILDAVYQQSESAKKSVSI